MDKQQLRSIIKQRKALLSSNDFIEEANNVFATIEALSVFKNASTILLYYSMPDELPTHHIIQRWCESKRILLPRINGNALDLLPFNGGELYKSQAFNVMEPGGTSAVATSNVDLFIIPAVALDRQCNRLGRGKGFYDRLLSSNNVKGYKIGVALNCQLVDSILVAPTDVPLDCIVTSSVIAFHGT